MGVKMQGMFREASPRLLAYLPQHIAEIAGVAIFVGVLISGLPALLFGRMSAKRNWSAPRVRLVAALALCVAAAWAALGFVINAEPRGGIPQGHWGSRTDGLLLIPWLLGIAGIAGWNLFREIGFLRRCSQHTR
jgi:hypothetical protein